MNDAAVLNGICPYFTMFPLSFPLRIIKKYANTNSFVVDPFCGRGTSNFAARLQGLPSFGMDTSPIAIAIAKAKLVNTDAQSVINVANECLDSVDDAQMPKGDFWSLAYHPNTLHTLCRFRAALLSALDDGQGLTFPDLAN